MGNLLKELRTEAGLAQRHVAEYMDTFPQTIGKVERGEQEVSYRFLKEYLKCVGVNMIDFVEMETADEEWPPRKRKDGENLRAQFNIRIETQDEVVLEQLESFIKGLETRSKSNVIHISNANAKNNQ